MDEDQIEELLALSLESANQKRMVLQAIENGMNEEMVEKIQEFFPIDEHNRAHSIVCRLRFICDIASCLKPVQCQSMASVLLDNHLLTPAHVLMIGVLTNDEHMMKQMWAKQVQLNKQQYLACFSLLAQNHGYDEEYYEKAHEQYARQQVSATSFFKLAQTLPSEVSQKKKPKM